MLVPGIDPGLHLLAVGFRCLEQDFTDLGVLLDELRDTPGGEAGPVGPDHELAVALGSGTDTDGGDRQGCGDFGGDAGVNVGDDANKSGISWSLDGGSDF
mgnify:CR=1 FL=1